MLYDLAFLRMDLWHRGLRDSANIGFNRHREITGDIEGVAAIPLFMSMRAAVRAHVLAAQARQNSAATALGMLKTGDTVMTGQELRQLPDGELAERIDRTRVYARVDPEQKIRIVSAF